MSYRLYDVVIIGGGPAGLSAAIYARRANLDTLVVEKASPGGQILVTAEIENYPGGIKGESGAEFAARLTEQAKSFGYEEAFGEIGRVDFSGDEKIVWVGDDEYRGRTVIIATGSVPSLLGVPGEMEYAGRGVSYCATCDGPFFRGLDVYVVGGGESAVEEAMHLSKFARRVTIIHRRDELRATQSTQASVKKCENIGFLFDTVVKEIRGDALLNALVVENVKTGEVSEIKPGAGDSTMGVFVFIGNKPQTAVFEGWIELEDGFIVTDGDMRTNLPGVYAAGDVRAKALRQLVTAAADGATAAVTAERDLE
ncbi:MAG: thioredoxin-disulfide reductase [Clostridiales Family XIII bacterium]|jgi:thioredoxin reductase (NADPH)|nr:thioredoxin-disulfide reductase [Clostridiales Family XIII bacterium]